MHPFHQSMNLFVIGLGVDANPNFDVFTACSDFMAYGMECTMKKKNNITVLLETPSQQHG